MFLYIYSNFGLLYKVGIHASLHGTLGVGRWNRLPVLAIPFETCTQFVESSLDTTIYLSNRWKFKHSYLNRLFHLKAHPSPCFKASLRISNLQEPKCESPQTLNGTYTTFFHIEVLTSNTVTSRVQGYGKPEMSYMKTCNNNKATWILPCFQISIIIVKPSRLVLVKTQDSYSHLCGALRVPR